MAIQHHEVTVVAARTYRESVSAAAAAIWFPHAVIETPRVVASAEVTFRRLVELSGDPETGVRLREGTVLSRHPDPDLSWTTTVPGCRPAEQVPPGTTGIRCSLPLAVTDIYLAWLHKQVESLGVHFKAREVSSMDEVPDCDAMVVAAGLGSAALLGDGEVYPIRGRARTTGRPSSAGSSTPE